MFQVNSEQIRQLIRENAAEISRLHSAIHEAMAQLDLSAEKQKAWRDACAEFHARYDALAFPEGFDGAYERIKSGDPFAMEAAICFVEVRPYFFRSGYMFKDILRKLKRASLSPDHASRVRAVVVRYEEWRRGRDRGRR